MRSAGKRIFMQRQRMAILHSQLDRLQLHRSVPSTLTNSSGHEKFRWPRTPALALRDDSSSATASVKPSVTVAELPNDWLLLRTLIFHLKDTDLSYSQFRACHRVETNNYVAHVINQDIFSGDFQCKSAANIYSNST